MIAAALLDGSRTSSFTCGLAGKLPLKSFIGYEEPGIDWFRVDPVFSPGQKLGETANSLLTHLHSMCDQQIRRLLIIGSNKMLYIALEEAI
jgi:hypothetical protein